MSKQTSMRFRNISKNLNDIVDELLKNKNLLKWITYLVDNPLSMPEVPPQKILGKQIVLTRVNPTILSEAETKVFIAPKGANDHRQGILANTIFEVNIASPNIYSYIYSTRQERFSEIASEIAYSLDGRHIAGVGDVSVSTNFTTYKINETYTGMMLHIVVVNQTQVVKKGY